MLNNIFIANDENKLIEQLKDNISKINSFSNDLLLFFLKRNVKKYLLKRIFKILEKKFKFFKI